MRKYILLILSLILLVNCSSGITKEQSNPSKWHEDCPYTDDNCGYAYESYVEKDAFTFASKKK